MERLRDPSKIAALAAKAQRRLERAQRFTLQVQRQAELKAKREAKSQAQAQAKALRDERHATKAALEAQRQAKRQARAERLAGIESRRQARLERKLAKEAKWQALAEKEEKAYQWRQRKAEIADYRENRLEYIKERKRLAKENPWALVLEQEDIVDLAYRRKLLLKQDERGARSVVGPDDPETIVEWRRLTKEFRSASSSWQHEKRRLRKLTLEAQAFDVRQAEAQARIETPETPETPEIPNGGVN
jgi:fused signal recognition particle receptor